MEQSLMLQDLYMKGDDLQKLSVIQSLPQLLQTDNNGTITRIIPKIQQELPNSSSEFHIVTSRIFKLLVQMNLSINLVRPMLQGIESKDPIVSNVWIETVLAVIPSLTEVTIKKEVLPCAIMLSQINQTIGYRVASCKMLGQIAIHPRITSLDVKKDILPIAQSLCQDCLYEVRAAICTELPNISKGLSNDNVIKTSLLPCLVELSSDENMLVRGAAVDAVVSLTPYLSADTIRLTIIPLVQQLCNQSSQEGDRTFSSVAKVYGMLLINLMPHLSNNEAVWFLNFFSHLSKRGFMLNEDLDIEPGLAVTCREYCAYNFPAVTYFTVSKIPLEIPNWYSTFKDLAGDPCYLVRKTVAGCIHEIARILGKENKFIVGDVVKLIRDDAEEVLESLVPKIGVTLDFFCLSGVLSRESTSQSSLEIGRALLKCQVELFKCFNWRRKMAFLEQLEYLPNCMPSDFIHQHFTPVVLRLTLEARSRPVRSQAARTMLIFLRYNMKENHRKWIRENLINLLCYAQSCYTRHIFINMCIHAISIFSKKYFKQYFYLPLLTLAEDPVSTVRLCVVNLCPVLKHMLVLPIDRNLQMKLENILSKMEIMEKDKDVIASLKNKLKDMRTPQVNKPDSLVEEKRRIEEEEKINQGKFAASPRADSQVTVTQPVRGPSYVHKSLTSVSKSSTLTNRSSPSRTAVASDMSFLGQHFYIDAGVVLPEKLNCKKICEDDIDNLGEDISKIKLNRRKENKMKIKKIEDELISTVSVENINVENMSDEDIKELEILTTNITDDVKANIQKISMGKATAESKMPTDSIKKRNKRYSCVFFGDQGQSSSNNKVLKRRSLNIGSHEVSKIPVCFKTTKKPAETNMRRSKSGSVQSINTNFDTSHILDSKARSSRIKVVLRVENVDKNNTSENKKKTNATNKISTKTSRECTKMDDNIGNYSKTEIKENVPLNDSIKSCASFKTTKDNSATKVSNLPVLIRRTQSEMKK